MIFVAGLRLLLWWERAFWVVPLFGVVLGLALNVITSELDNALFQELGGEQIVAEAAATTILASIGGAMVTFTGLVFSFVVLMLQFGSGQYSPRTVSYFLRFRTTQWILAIFLTTITVAFLSVVEVGSEGRRDFTPDTGVLLSLALLLLSLASFIMLLHLVGSRIRVDAVLTGIGRKSRKRLNRLHRRQLRRSAQSVIDPEPVLADTPLVRLWGRQGQLVAINSQRLLQVAARRGCHLQTLARVGDSVSSGVAVLAVTAGTRPTDAELQSAFVVDTERSLRFDPLYALRIVVDVALKALSPAVNDPTTAVRALDEVDGILRTAQALELGTFRVDAGDGSVTFRYASWGDIVTLGLLEIIEFGQDQPQVTRRLTALLSDLLRDLPPERHPALLQMQAILADRVHLDGDLAQQRFALHPDRQGIGGSGT